MYVLDKPVLTFYKERHDRPEREAFVVVKAHKLLISKLDDEGFSGKIVDFFPLMGSLDCISSVEGMHSKYVLCWFDDTVNDLSKAWRRLTGVVFSDQVPYVVDDKGKRTYNATFNAEHAKLS